MTKLTASDFTSLLVGSTRWIDVRAPVEFQEGAIPGAVNLPLLTDSERHAIGLTYKNEGQEAAIRLGHELVSGRVREERVAGWKKEIEAHPDAVIYCFRGGLRSQITQSWLAEAGIHRPIIEGGYKALRQFLLAALETQIDKLAFEVVTGPTGSGKTAYIHASGKPFIDLEDLAKHRGSAFGSLPEAQPSQVNFENSLAMALLKLGDGHEPILIEDESRLIGRCALPENLYAKIHASPKIRLEVPLEERVERIFKDYVLDSNLGKTQDPSKFESFQTSIESLARKLGGTRTQELLSDLENSRKDFETGKGLDSNRIWIRKILEWHYDPFYQFALERSEKSR
jgi:tRNA 2-selenouridine synthase